MACWLGIRVNINSQIRISILAFKGFSSFKHKMVVCVGGGEPRESPSRPKMMMVISICLPPYSSSVFLETHCPAFTPQYNCRERRLFQT